jgi:hypothetical protein
VINVSTTGQKAPFLDDKDEEFFLRIPVNDCLNAQLLPYFDQAYSFIGKENNSQKKQQIHCFFNILEKARQNNGRVFIHCLGL